MPEAISASRMDEGPTSGTTRTPASWARRTKAAPGSATAGQPASDRSPQSSPAARRATASVTAWPPPSGSSTSMRSSRSGRGWPACFRKRRADFAFSATKASRRRAISSAGPGSTARASPPPKSTGIRYNVPLPACASDKRQAFVSQHGGELHERQANQRAGVVAADALHQHDAQPLDFGAARAVVGTLDLEIALDLAVGVVAKAHLGRDVRGL